MATFLLVFPLNIYSQCDTVLDSLPLPELKHYKKLSDNQLKSFWDKLLGEAKLHNKRPVLLYRENYKSIKVMMYGYIGTCRIPVILDYISFKDIIEAGMMASEEKVYW